GLERRLSRLCERLAREVMQEALLIVPVRPNEWVEMTKVPSWSVVGNVSQNFERAEQDGTIPVGTEGAYLEAPPLWKRRLSRAKGRCVFSVARGGLSIRIGGTRALLWRTRNKKTIWQWAYHRPVVEDFRPVIIGATLVYGKNREPHTVRRTD